MLTQAGAQKPRKYVSYPLFFHVSAYPGSLTQFCLYSMSKISTFLTTHFLGDVNFQVFGKKPDSDTGNEKDDHPSPAYLPSAFESGLWTTNVVDLVNPSTVSPATGRQRGKR